MNPNNDPGVPQLDIAAVLFENLRGRGLAADPDAFRESVGEQPIIVGNVLLNTNPDEYLAREEIAERSGMTVEEADAASDILKGWIVDGPLRWTAIADHEIRDLRYKIVPTEPKETS